MWNHCFHSWQLVLCCFNSEFTKKINKITYKTDKYTNIFVILLVLFVILLIFFVNSLFKQQSTQLPAMKAVISHEIFQLCSLFLGTEEIPWCDGHRRCVRGFMPHWIDCCICWSSWHRGGRLKLCRALLLPFFFHCDVVFSHMSSVDSRRLQVAFNSSTRYVYNLRRYDHLSTRRNELLGVPFFILMIFVFFRSFSSWFWRGDLVISLLTLLVRISLNLLTLFFHQSVRGLRCWSGQFVILSTRERHLNQSKF
jgi:hypothetical protein